MQELATSVVITAPCEVQRIAVPVMRQYAPHNLVRFRPHVTLMFPFVPFNELAGACDTLDEIGKSVPPFDVTLNGYGKFPGVIYMKLDNPAPVKALYRRLYNAFPDYPPYEGEFGTELSPHLTVAHFEDEAEQPATPLPDYTPLTFCVERLHVWYGIRDEDLPWLTYHVVRLRG